jgi:hypothetical protein
MSSATSEPDSPGTQTVSILAVLIAASSEVSTGCTSEPLVAG